jgi:NADH-quinone oxidoreductase subunit G
MLQEHYMDSGRHESRLPDEVGKQYKGGPDHRFTDTKGVDRGGKHIDLGPTIVLDQERCILCDRCVRFMRDVAGDEQLYIAGRGDHAYLTTFPGEPLDHPYDLNTTDICPVGALTGKHFRFQQRVWFLKKTNSISPDDSLGANITIEHNRDQVWRLMPRRNPHVNKSWLHNESRMLYTTLGENRFVEGFAKGAPATRADALVAAGQVLSAARKVAVVATGHGTLEDNAALLALADGLGDQAEVFGGSWLPVGEGDGIARSGDPVVNRKGLKLLGISDNLDSLVERASEFDAIIIAQNDLWAADAEKAAALEAIPHRVVLGSWDDATRAKASVAIGVRCWAEVRGTMVNCNGRAQLLNACPVCPDQELEPTWQAIVRLSGHACDKPIPWAGAADAWRAVQARIPALAKVLPRHIGPLGLQLALEPEPETVEASA